jgi:dTDP-4-dehydrorhamnose reductase
VLRRWLVDCGRCPERELDELVDNPCPPDIIGLNYYVTSDRFLDEDVATYPPHVHGGNGREVYADVEAVRARSSGLSGFGPLLDLLWERYRTPLAITEAHLGCIPAEQVRWLHEAWNAARTSRARGADVRAVTLWSAFGACDWDSLLTASRGHYEPGAFDVRGGSTVHPTLLASVARDLAIRRSSDHPLLREPGWWRRPDRVLYPRAECGVGSASETIPLCSTTSPICDACAPAVTKGHFPSRNR